MKILTLGDFLDRELAFRKRLNAYYAKIRDRTEDNGIRLLTYHLGRDRGRHAIALSNLPRETIDHARKAAFVGEEPFDPKVERRLPAFDHATVTGNDLLEDAVSRQSRQALRYRILLTQFSDEAVRIVLAALVHVKERDIDLMKKMQTMHYFDR